MSGKSQEAWFIFRTEPGKEAEAQKALATRGFADAWYPVRFERRHRNRYDRVRRKAKHLVPYPIMPGYIFVRMPHGLLGWFFAGQHEHTAFKRDGSKISWRVRVKPRSIRSLLSFNGDPVSLPDPLVAQMMQAFDGNRLVAPEEHKHMRTHHEFKVGDTVNVVEGSLKEQQVVVEEINRDVAISFIEAFGGRVKVSIPLDQLESAD